MLGSPQCLPSGAPATALGWVWVSKVLAPPRSSWSLVLGVSDSKFSSFPIFHDRHWAPGDGMERRREGQQVSEQRGDRGARSAG